MNYIAEINDQEYQIRILEENLVEINGDTHQINFQALGDHLTYSLLVDGKSFEVNVYQENGTWEVLMRGKRYSVRVEDERERLLRSAGGSSVLQEGKFCLQAPMPGLVIDIPVQEGDLVEKGDVLLILESMKMQNELISPQHGQVTGIRVEVHENVDRHQTLLLVK